MIGYIWSLHSLVKEEKIVAHYLYIDTFTVNPISDNPRFCAFRVGCLFVNSYIIFTLLYSSPGIAPRLCLAG